MYFVFVSFLKSDYDYNYIRPLILAALGPMRCYVFSKKKHHIGFQTCINIYTYYYYGKKKIAIKWTISFRTVVNSMITTTTSKRRLTTFKLTDRQTDRPNIYIINKLKNAQYFSICVHQIWSELRHQSYWFPNRIFSKFSAFHSLSFRIKRFYIMFRWFHMLSTQYTQCGHKIHSKPNWQCGCFDIVYLCSCCCCCFNLCVYMSIYIGLHVYI